MKKPLFTGACTALVTPFREGRIDYDMLRLILRRQTDAGISAVAVAGTTGEAATLSDEEKLSLIRASKACLSPSCLLIAGTGSNDTAHAAALSREAQRAGADALLVISPYCNRAAPEGLIRHYEEIAGAVSIPVILYNVPSRTGVDLSVPVCRALARIPNIAGIKEASGSLARAAEILAVCPPEFSVWSGCDALTVPMMSIGARGVISVASNLYPAEIDAMALAALDGDFDTAAQLQLQYLPLISLLFREVNPIPVKAAMKILGYDCGPGRLPLTPAGDSLCRELKQLLG